VALGLGEAPQRGQGPAQADQGVDVLGLLLDPALVVAYEAGLVVVAEEDLLDLAAELAVEPALGAEPAEQGLEVAEGLVGPSESGLELGGLHGELGPAEGVGYLAGEVLEPGESLCGQVLLGECGGDLLLDAEVAGEECLEPRPDPEGLVGLLGA